MFKLTKGQKIAISLLAESNLSDKFYWTGGTLLAAYYFQHRMSYDLDFFSETNFTFKEVNPFVQSLKKELGTEEVDYKRILDRYEFMFKNKEALRIDFVLYNNEKKTLKKRKRYLGLLIDSLEDISANKTISLLDRKEPKDLFDIYFILTKSGISAKEILDFTEKKFGVRVSEDVLWSHSMTTLSKLKELKPIMLGGEKEKEELIYDIESFFRERSRKFLHSWLG